MRLKEREDSGKDVFVIHLGDHDPSGIDMTRDIQDRFAVFGCKALVRRVALNFDQVKRYAPPPNPAKVTDSRYAEYEKEYGEESWELDALTPEIITNLIEREIDGLRDEDEWAHSLAKQDAGRKQLRAITDRWGEVVDYLGE